MSPLSNTSWAQSLLFMLERPLSYKCVLQPHRTRWIFQRRIFRKCFLAPLENKNAKIEIGGTFELHSLFVFWDADHRWEFVPQSPVLPLVTSNVCPWGHRYYEPLIWYRHLSLTYRNGDCRIIWEINVVCSIGEPIRSIFSSFLHFFPRSRAVNWIPRGSKVGLKKKDTSDVNYPFSSKVQDAF